MLPFFFLGQETLPSLLNTGWFHERISSVILQSNLDKLRLLLVDLNMK